MFISFSWKVTLAFSSQLFKIYVSNFTILHFYTTKFQTVILCTKWEGKTLEFQYSLTYELYESHSYFVTLDQLIFIVWDNLQAAFSPTPPFSPLSNTHTER